MISACSGRIHALTGLLELMRHCPEDTVPLPLQSIAPGTTTERTET